MHTRKSKPSPIAEGLDRGGLLFLHSRGVKTRLYMGPQEAMRASPQGRPSGGRAPAPAPPISSYPLRSPKLRVSRGQRPWGPPWQGGFGWVESPTSRIPTASHESASQPRSGSARLDHRSAPLPRDRSRPHSRRSQQSDARLPTALST